MDRTYTGVGDRRNTAILQAEHLTTGTLRTSTTTMILVSQALTPNLLATLLLWSGRQSRKLGLVSLSDTRITVKHFTSLRTIIRLPISLASTRPTCSEGQIDSNRIYHSSHSITEKFEC